MFPTPMLLQVFYHDPVLRGNQACALHVAPVPGELKSKFTTSEKPYVADSVMQMSKC